MQSSAYPVHRSASQVNCSGADAQVVSCHRYLVVFHPFVEQLTFFHTSGLVLASSSILRVLIVMASWAARAKEVRKLCVNQYISMVNLLRTDIHTYIHTYIQAQPQTKTPLAHNLFMSIHVSEICSGLSKAIPCNCFNYGYKFCHI